MQGLVAQQQLRELREVLGSQLRTCRVADRYTENPACMWKMCQQLGKKQLAASRGCNSLLAFVVHPLAQEQRRCPESDTLMYVLTPDQKTQNAPSDLAFPPPYSTLRPIGWHDQDPFSMKTMTKPCSSCEIWPPNPEAFGTPAHPASPPIPR